MSAPIVLALRLILAATLYFFLGWVLFTLWKDLQQQGTQLAIKRIPGISLSVALGENILQRHFSQSEITVGRDPNCDLPLQDERVSAHHARLAYHHGQWWLEDLNSTNGTLLNNERLSIPAVVMTGDDFQCGNATLTIRIQADGMISPNKRS